MQVKSIFQYGRAYRRLFHLLALTTSLAMCGVVLHPSETKAAARIQEHGITELDVRAALACVESSLQASGRP